MKTDLCESCVKALSLNKRPGKLLARQTSLYRHMFGSAQTPIKEADS